MSHIEDQSVGQILRERVEPFVPLPIGLQEDNSHFGSKDILQTMQQAICQEISDKAEQKGLLYKYKNLGYRVYRTLKEKVRLQHFTSSIERNNQKANVDVQIQYSTLDSLDMLRDMNRISQEDYDRQRALEAEGKTKIMTVVRTLGYTNVNNAGPFEDQFALFYMLQAFATFENALKNRKPGEPLPPLPTIRYICLPSFQAGGQAPSKEVIKLLQDNGTSILDAEAEIYLKFLDTLPMMNNLSNLVLHGDSKGAIVAYHMARRLPHLPVHLIMTSPVGFKRYPDDKGIDLLSLGASYAPRGNRPVRAEILRHNAGWTTAHNANWNRYERMEIMKMIAIFEKLPNCLNVRVSLANEDRLALGFGLRLNEVEGLYKRQGAEVEVHSGGHTEPKFTPIELKLQVENLLAL